MAVERLKVLATEILPGDAVIGWDRSGAREPVVQLIDAPHPSNVGLAVAVTGGTAGLFIPRTAHVFIERNTHHV